MSDVPPPPPPHGTPPRSSGLPPGKYDIFVIPEHSAGAGFLYLPSLRPNVNSFFAGFASALILVAVFQSMAPAFRVWWQSFQGLGNMGLTLLIFGVGFGAWALGRTQKDGPSTSSHYHSSYSSSGGGPGYTPGGFGSSPSGSPPPRAAPHGSPPPPPPHSGPPPHVPRGGGGGAGPPPQTRAHSPPPQSRPRSPPPQSRPRSPRPQPRPRSPPPQPRSHSPRPQARPRTPPPPQARPRTPPPQPRPRSPLPQSRPRSPPPQTRSRSPPPPPSPPPTPSPPPSSPPLTSPPPPPPPPTSPPKAAPQPTSPPPTAMPPKPPPPTTPAPASKEEKPKASLQRPTPPASTPKSPTPKGAWEKAREETRRKEEERKAKEAEQKRREEALRRLAELRAKEAKEREEREKEKERKEKEAREKKLKEEADQRRKELVERLRRERAEKAKEEQKKKEEEAAAAAAAAAAATTTTTTTTTATATATAAPATPATPAPPGPGSSMGASTTRVGSTYAFSSVGERTSMWPNGRPPQQAKSATTSSPEKKTPSAEKRQTAPSESTYSYRPYDEPKKTQRQPSMSSYTGSDASWAQSHTTARTTPTPSVRGPYTTKDPDKIVIQAVYLFMNEYAKTPASQLVSGVGSVTDGLILRITTEGLFIDDDVRGVPQREWDVKAWTLKLVEVWCPPHCLGSSGGGGGGASNSSSRPISAPHLLYKMATARKNGERDGSKVLTGEEADAYLGNMLRTCKECCRLGLCDATLKKMNVASSSQGQMGTWKQKGLHILRATIRDQAGKRYMFVMSEQESWKLAFGLQRLRGGTQVRQLGVAGMASSEARGTLEMLGWGG